MRLARIQARNFLSFAELDLEVPPAGLWVVAGRNEDAPGASSNGAGKSSVLDAVLFALYGATLRGVAHDGVVRRNSRGGCRVAVKLEAPDGTAWTVVRYRSDPKMKNALAILEDGSPVSQDRMRDAQEQVNRILGLDRVSFERAAVFGQDATRFLEQTDAEQKAVLERLFGLDELRAALARVRADVARVEADAGRARADHDAKAKIVAYVASQIEAHEREVHAWEAERAREVARCESELRELERRRPAFTEGGLRKLERLRDQARDALERERALRAELDAKLKVLRADQARVNRELLDLDEQRRRVERLKGTCPTCMAPVTRESKRACLEALDAKREALARDLKEVQRQLAALPEPPRADPAACERAEREHAAYLRRLGEERSEREAEARFLAQELERLRSEPNPHRETLGRLRGDLERARADAEGAARRCDELSGELGDLRVLERCFGPKGATARLMDYLLAFLEERANEHLQELTGGTMRLSLSTLRETKAGELSERITARISYATGAETYEALSAGERQRLDVAVALALFDLARSRSGGSLGFVAFDEVFERLDEEGCEAVARLLARRAPEWGTVFVLTHQARLLDTAGKRITVVKRNGVSRIDGA